MVLHDRLARAANEPHPSTTRHEVYANQTPVAQYIPPWVQELVLREEAERPAIGFSVYLPFILLAGLVIRVLLIPLTQGYDFHTFVGMTKAGLAGRDIYDMSQPLKAPWAYFPLCFDMYLGLGWIAQHSPWGFDAVFPLLGKAPVVVADLLIGSLIYRALQRRGHTEKTALTGACLYIFNPLVLYNGAFYGRFDAIALALLLLALEFYRSRWFSLLFAFSIAAKTFPLFLVPLFAFGRDRQPIPKLVAAVALVPLLSLPYVVTDLHGLLAHLAYARPIPGRLSWYSLLLENHWLTQQQLSPLAALGFYVLYPLSLFLFLKSPLYVKAAATTTLFLVLSNVVYEQYLLWPLPFLIIVGLHYRSRLALGLVFLCTLAALLENEETWKPTHFHYHLAATPSVPLNVGLAVCVVAAALIWRFSRWDRRVAPLKPVPPPVENAALGAPSSPLGAQAP